MVHPLAPPLQIALVLLTAPAAYFDLKTRRIPNWLSMVGCLLGVATNTILAGFEGLSTALLGLGVGFVLYFPLWLLGARGAGDVKLLAAAGSAAGPANTLALFLLAALLGGMLALGLILFRGATRKTLVNVVEILGSLVRFKLPRYTLASPGALRLPHALVVFLAVAAEIIMSHASSPFPNP